MTYCSNGIPRLHSVAPKTHVSGKDIIRYYKQRTQVIQAIQEHKETSKSSELTMALYLKWLTEKQRWVKQWPFMEEKLQEENSWYRSN